ncbi:MAG TPA: polysulfide reductase NrfD, partial [Bdellovibrionales bacterium]|nr:polysulfide reductase NrfD [Bdellovibrionales bacterium]
MIRRAPLILGKKTYETITDDISGLVERLPDARFLLGLGGAQFLLLIFLAAQGMIVWYGMGLMGVNHPVGWGTDIITFVFWIGIGHAGPLISAVLFFFRQKWRTSIARTAEAMTVFAVMTAGLFPVLHTGRPWLAYWLLPYPNQRGPLWVNFRSPLVWDVFAVSTYATVSAVFWYIGMVPDLATIRDRAKNPWRKRIYGALSLGWRGTARNWNHYEMVYMLLAGLLTPLGLLMHSIVG